MVKLVNRRENNRISKMHNYREVYKGHYNSMNDKERQYQRNRYLATHDNNNREYKSTNNNN